MRRIQFLLGLFAVVVCSVNAQTEITTAEQFNNLDLNGNYILMADIDLTTGNYLPIGGKYSSFNGTFDGNGYTIKITDISDDYTNRGLFSIVGPEGVIKNLKVKGQIFNARSYDSYTGGIVGKNNGTIINCLSTVSVNCGSVGNNQSRSQTGGGIAGINEGTISYCVSASSIMGADYCNGIGGIVGSNSGIIENCIYGRDNINLYWNNNTSRYGMICGYADSETDANKIQNCYYKANDTFAGIGKYGGFYADESRCTPLTEEGIKALVAEGGIYASTEYDVFRNSILLAAAPDELTFDVSKTAGYTTFYNKYWDYYVYGSNSNKIYTATVNGGSLVLSELDVRQYTNSTRIIPKGVPVILNIVDTETDYNLSLVKWSDDSNVSFTGENDLRGTDVEMACSANSTYLFGMKSIAPGFSLSQNTKIPANSVYIPYQDGFADRDFLSFWDPSPAIVFADATAKSICLTNWDKNGDGELSEAEAAAVTTIGSKFNKKTITTFNELQYFTGLTSIGSSAFKKCSLTSITIPNGVTNIGSYAFDDCANLTTVMLSNSVTNIGSGAFSGCSSLASITIPSSVSSIGSSAWKGCFALSTMIVENGNTKYDSRDNCNAIIETSSNKLIAGCQSTVIPSSVTTIGENAFYSIASLTSISIPNSVTTIGEYAFRYCAGLTSVAIPSSVTTIDGSAFSNTGLISVTIPGSVTTLGGSAFEKSQLTSVEILEGVTSLSALLFDRCTSLASVKIPSTVTSIGSGAFSGCSSLSTVTVANSTPVAIDASTFSNSANATLYVPAGSKAAYEAADYWKDFKEIKEIVTVTPNDGSAENPFSCAEAHELVAELTADTPTETEYYIKGKVSTMVSNFGYQSGHATFMISDDGTKNGEFTISQSLYFNKQAYDGGRIPNIGDEVVISGKLINLNGTTYQTANEDCQLVSINGKTTALPLEYGDLFSSMTADYSKDLFFVAGCMTEPGKPNSENMGCSIGYAVDSRPETKSGAPTAIDSDYEGTVVLPESADGLELRTIAPSAFAGAKLTSIIIPATVWDIETDAFNGCTNLASVTLPEGVTLNRRSFQDCTALTSVSLPKGVILYGLDGEYIFGGCTNLTSITVNDETPYELQDNCIIDNPSLVTLYVPAGSKAAYEAADYWKDFKIEEQGVVWAVPDIEEIPAGTKYELDNITLTIGEAGSPDFTVDPGDAYDETFIRRIAGNNVNGDKEGGTFYLFTPKKNGNLTVIVRQGKTKQFYVEESGRVMEAFNGLYPETDEDTYKGTYTIPVFANLTYKIYCAGSKMGFYGFTFNGRDDADETNITFADEEVKTLCVANWDTNNDQELSMTEAAAVATLGDVFKENSEITSFDELRFFTGLTDISGWETFYGCDALTSVTIPASVISLDGGTFAGCSALEQIRVDPGNTVYCTRQNGNAIIEKATNKLVVGNKTGEIPDGVTVIGADAFHGRHQLQWIGIPESVTELESGAFAWCTGLEGVEIPSSVQKIGGWAFTGTSLWSVTLPESLTTIGESAFEGCYNLYEVTVQNQEPLALQNPETFSNRANATLFVPSGCKAAYLAADYWKDFKLIAEGVVAEKNWDSPKWAISYEGTDATCEVTAEGLALTNPRKQEEIWTPQTSVTDDCLTLVEGHDYKVRLTAKVPSDGTYQVQLGNWGGYDQYEVEATAGSEPQVIEVDFPDFCCNVNGDGHVIFQNGFVVGTTVVQKVEVIDMTDDENVIAEQSWTGPYWFGEEGTDATYEMTSEGLAINNPTATEDLWRPQTSVLEGVTLQEGHGYKVIITAKIPSDGNLQVQIGNWEKEQMYAIPVQASEDFQDIEALFEGYTGNTNNGHIFFQNGGIAGTSIVKYVKVIDLGLNPNYVPEPANAIYMDDQTGNVSRTFSMDIKLKNENPVRAYSFDLQLPEGVTIAKDANGDEEMELSGRHDSYAPTVNYVESSNTYRLGATSRVAGNDGVIMTLRLQVSDQMPTGEYYIRILNAIYTQADNYQDIHMPETSAKLTIGEKDYIKGDVNDDDDIDIADVVCVVNHVVGIETPRYYEAAADVTGNNEVTISDAVMILDYIVGEIEELGPIATTARRLALSRSMNERDLTGILDAATLNDALYANDLVIKPGNETPLTISLKNANETNGYSFDLILPDGVTLAKDGDAYKYVLSSRHHSSHEVKIKYKEETRTYSVVVYSLSSKKLSGNDGEVLTFKLDVTDAVASDATLSIQNCKYSLTSGASKVSLPREEVKLIKEGDANVDGTISKSDAIAALSYILGDNPADFFAAAADMNGDGIVTVTDVILLLIAVQLIP